MSDLYIGRDGVSATGTVISKANKLSVKGTYTSHEALSHEGIRMLEQLEVPALQGQRYFLHRLLDDGQLQEHNYMHYEYAWNVSSFSILQYQAVG